MEGEAMHSTRVQKGFTTTLVPSTLCLWMKTNTQKGDSLQSSWRVLAGLCSLTFPCGLSIASLILGRAGGLCESLATPPNLTLPRKYPDKWAISLGHRGTWESRPAGQEWTEPRNKIYHHASHEVQFLSLLILGEFFKDTRKLAGYQCPQEHFH